MTLIKFIHMFKYRELSNNNFNVFPEVIIKLLNLELL